MQATRSTKTLASLLRMNSRCIGLSAKAGFLMEIDDLNRLQIGIDDDRPHPKRRK